MNRKLMSVTLVALVVVACGPQALMTPAWGDTLQLVSVTTLSYPYSGTPYDLTALGATDWAMSGVSEKAGGTAIETFGYGNTGYTWQVNDANSVYPLFSFTDGDTAYGGAAQTGVVAMDRLDYGTVIVDLPAGSGTLTVWSGSIAAVTYGCSLGAKSVTYSDAVPSPDMAVISYQTATAQQLVFASDLPGGIFAAALSITTPEPGTMALLATGLFGLLAYAWRKRR